MSLDLSVAEEIVKVAYRNLFNREPDAGGLRAYSNLILKSENQIGVVLQSMFSSNEFKRRWVSVGAHSSNYSEASDTHLKQFTTKDVAANSKKLSTESPVSLEQFRARVAQYVKPGEWGSGDYYGTHEMRFLEIQNCFEVLLENKPNIDVLDIGGSVFTKILKLSKSGVSVDLLDRFFAANLREVVRHFFNVDLSDPDTFGQHQISPRYDFIIFTEVIEHLLSNPKRVISFLGGLLKPGGFLYLTTPNFFSASKLDLIAQRRNPQPIYPETYAKADAVHFHVREYCMSELLEICRQSGLGIHAYFFSDCWEGHLSQKPKAKVEERGNLVVVATKEVIV